MKLVKTPAALAIASLVGASGSAFALVAELEGGADFAELAREHSTGPSGPNGGQLGKANGAGGGCKQRACHADFSELALQMPHVPLAQISR